MKKTKPQSKKTVAAKKTNSKKTSLASNSKKLHILIALLVIFGSIVGASALIPDQSPLSLESMISRSTDKVAPSMDTLEGNYSVSGEATSTSVLVKYKSATPEQAKAKINQELGGKTKRNIGNLGVDIVQVTSTESVGETVKKYKSRAEVEYVEPNYLAKRFLTPNDTLFAKQWHLQKIEAPKAWDVSQGGFGPIAIIDTGIASSQADLVSHVIPGYNFVSDNTNTNDDNGHGTHVAGIVSASTNNSTGVASIGFKGPLMPVKVLDGTGAGTYGDVASGIVFAVDNGAKIINLSLGGSTSSITLHEAIKYALARGVVVVAAAGNNGNSAAVFPAAYPGVVAVSASDQNDNLAAFSSYGNHVYVSAPGAGIISTYNTGGYVTLSGTSMATPVVSGLIGLALSKGSVTAASVLDSLKTTSDKVGPYAYDQNGRNQYFGYGRINAAKLLGITAVSPTVATTTTTTTESTKPIKTNKRSEKASNNSSQTANVQFDTVIEGSIDSLDVARGVLVIKVKSSSNNLELRTGNLIDLYVKPATIIRSGNSDVAFSSLQPGSNLNIKAEWSNNQLSAQEIKISGKGRNN